MQDLIAMLSHPQSAKRRSAARNLRKAKNKEAGPDLLAALKRELKDPRTWETQYQMIMALADCEYREAVPFLSELVGGSRDSTAVDAAVGYALALLTRDSPDDVSQVLKLLESKNTELINGALSALAVARINPRPDAIKAILEYVTRFGDDDAKRYTVVASAGWRSPIVTEFLTQCQNSDWNLLRDAAQLAAKGKYAKLTLL